MKILKFGIFVSLILIFSSCEDDCVSLGSVKYYPSFLWEKSNITPVKKTIDFDFSMDAQNDSNSYAQFQFVDNQGKPISTKIIQVYDGNVPLVANSFSVSSKEKSKELTFVFSPEASSGKYQGYLKLVGHNLDRIESLQLSSGQQVDVFQWTLYFEKCMNPLAKILMWVSIALLALLVIWFVVLRPIFYPHFGQFRKSILIQKEGIIVAQQNFIFTGARMVVFYDKKIKQSFWNRLFVGEIKTLVNPNFKTKLTFTPRRRNALVRGEGYAIIPNPIPRSGMATVNNIQQKLTITIC